MAYRRTLSEPPTSYANAGGDASGRARSSLLYVVLWPYGVGVYLFSYAIPTRWHHDGEFAGPAAGEAASRTNAAAYQPPALRGNGGVLRGASRLIQYQL